MATTKRFPLQAVPGGSVLLVGGQFGTPLDVLFGLSSGGISTISFGTITGPVITFPTPAYLQEAHEGQLE